MIDSIPFLLCFDAPTAEYEVTNSATLYNTIIPQLKLIKLNPFPRSFAYKQQFKKLITNKFYVNLILAAIFMCAS